MRIIFDLDGVIALSDDKINYILDSKPNLELIDLMKKLKTKGHEIAIYTARRMRTHKGNVAAVIADCAADTINWLKKYEVPFDEIAFGKPYGQLYIDDLAVGFDMNLVIERLQGILDE